MIQEKIAALRAEMARLDDRMGEIMAEIADLEDQQDEQDAREYHAQNPDHLDKMVSTLPAMKFCLTDILNAAKNKGVAK